MKGKFGSSATVFGVLVAAALLIVSVCGSAEARTLKFYAPYPADSYTSQALVDLTDMLREKTNGEIDFKVYPAGQLGTYEDSIEEVRAGTIEASYTWLTRRYHPKLDLGNLPGLCALGFSEYELMFLDKESPFCKIIAGYCDEAGLVSLGGWVDPRHGFALSKVPANPKDNNTKDVTIRVPAMPPIRDMAAAMGYNTVTMDYSEVYSAIQTGQIDGASALPAEDAYLQGRDMLKAFDANYLDAIPGWLIINKDLWESFGPEKQQIFRDCIDKAIEKWLPIAREADAKYEKLLEEYGIQVIRYTPQEMADRATVIRAKVWPNYVEAYGEDVLKALEDAIQANQKKLLGK